MATTYVGTQRYVTSRFVSTLTPSISSSSSATILTRSYATTVPSTTTAQPPAPPSAFPNPIVFTVSTLSDGGTLYKHNFQAPSMPVLLKSAEAVLSDQQKDLVRKLRQEDPLKYNASQLSKMFSVKQASIRRIAPLDDSVRVQTYGASMVNKRQPEKKADLQKWKDAVRLKEHEAWANKKKRRAQNERRHKDLMDERREVDYLNAKATERIVIEEQVAKERMYAEDDEMKRKGLIKGILKNRTLTS
eukprot:TRINITY_DN1487_c0_g1_i1.p1 TRINITY_DN1487_c0_g1~~TRINITY_DN1487_c0_g1_i1.p1  ORF type:complete len:246 (-),score=82.14 TRINITY_DN1487_c0_g1_i1:24-761(-)